jgi:hypothetical protein
MIRALVNGRKIHTPKALQVFERASVSVNARLGLVDSGLIFGTLVTKSAEEVILKAFQAGPTKLTFKEVKYYYKKTDWSTISGPAWAVQSAKAFVLACMQTCAEIEFEGL